MDLSLEDLIKKNKKTKTVGGRKKLSTASPVKRGNGGKVGKKPVTKNFSKPQSKGLLDARSKIIQKNRFKIRDAREIIAVNARKHIKDARELLSSSKKPGPGPRALKKPTIPRSRPNRLAKPPIDPDLLMDDDDFDLHALNLKPVGSLKRTVRNEMFRTAPPVSMPKLPSFSIHQESRLSPESDPFDCYVVPQRHHVPMPPIRPERLDRGFHHGRPMIAHMDDYNKPQKSILRSSQRDDHDDRFQNDRYFSISGTSSSENVRSRLYNESSRDNNESAGIFAKLPVRGSSPPSAQVGHRIIISNLHKSVTENDVRELFEDIGPLVTAHLVKAGIAEVIYKNLGDAEEAVESYHNRQLDGQPMKCMLVRSSAKPSYSRL